MRTDMVFTLTGKDRIGIVDQVTELLLGLGGNVEASRMARLGGEFAILMLVSLPAERMAALEQAVATLRAQGFQVTTSLTEPVQAPSHKDWLPFKVQVHGADHEGIVHEIAHYLSHRGITIESMDAGTTTAPVSASPLFTMEALVLVPPSLLAQDWQGALQEVGRHLNVDVQVSAESRS